MGTNTSVLGAALGATMLLSGAAAATELRIGMASEPSAIDPHYHNLGPNNEIRRHMFESLIEGEGDLSETERMFMLMNEFVR